MSALVPEKSNIEGMRRGLFSILALSLLTGGVILSWALKWCHYGFNFTDESFYLSWMSNPWVYPTYSVTLFGFFYHPLYLITHGDIALLRQSNLLLNFTLSWFLCGLSLHETLKIAKQNFSLLWITSISAIFALASLSYCGVFKWLITPSYNSLVFQGLLILSLGINLAQNNSSKRSITGWVILGFGGWILFVARSISIILLGLTTLSYLIFTRKAPQKYLWISISAGMILFGITVYFADGSLTAFVNRMQNGLQLFKLLQFEQSIFRLNFFTLPLKEVAFFVLLTLLAIVNALLFTANKRNYFYIAVSMSLIGLLVIYGLIFNDFKLHVGSYRFNTYLLALPLSLCVLSLILIGKPAFTSISREQYAKAIFYAAIPYLSSFGSTNNYWDMSELYAVFWIFSALTLFLPSLVQYKKTQILISLGITILILTTFNIYTAVEFPYLGLKPLYQNNNTVEMFPANVKLKLSSLKAKYIEQLHRVSKQNNFKPNTPVLDLTGETPGAVYLLGASPLGSHWMVGGQKGSNNFASYLLNKIDKNTLAKAWILLEPNNNWRLSTELLAPFGLDINKDYELVAEFSFPRYKGNNHQQLLLKPKENS